MIHCLAGSLLFLPNSNTMANICIITDSTAQFTQSNFPGHERVYVIPFGIQNSAYEEGKHLPGGMVFQKQLISPSPEEFIRLYTRLSREYDSIFVLTLSSSLTPITKHALAASDQYINCATVDVIDSQTTGIGLGMLVEIAAGAASEGVSLKELDQLLRASIPRIYMLFCFPELTYLANSGLINYDQAVVAEMMGMLPIFTFEEGQLVPMEKVRTPRHMFEAFQDFMGEFEMPSQIALMRSPVRGSLRTNPLRQFVEETFPDVLFSEHHIQPHLAALFGPHSIGLVVMESME
jgi:DegV family protein with EDD domain